MQPAGNDLSTHATTRIHSHAIGIRRLLLLFILLCVSFGLTLWLQLAQAATSAYNERVPSGPAISQSPISSPLASSAPDPGAFTLLTELRPEVTNFVTALGQLRAERLSSFLSGSSLSSLPLSGLRVGPPPVFTQPNRNPSAQSPALIDQHAVYLPLIQRTPAPVPASPPPPPPFSCKNPSSTYRIQCQALLAFYASTQGDYWLKNDGWLRASDYCDWYGVTCDQANNVVSLELNGNGLLGHIPDEIGLLPLTSLQVSNNTLVGVLPEALVASVTLRNVDIRQNRFTGSYPMRFVKLSSTPRSSDGKMAQWQENRFTRIDSRSFACTPDLSISVIDCRALLAIYRSTDGENLDSYHWNRNAGDKTWLLQADPCQWIGVNCASYHVIKLAFRSNTSPRLTGALPSHLGNLTELTKLVIEGGELTNPLPPEIGLLRKLRFLSIVDSRLPGGVPFELGYLGDLEELDLAGNQPVGPIPATLGNLQKIRRIDLSRNLLSGPIPDELALINSGANTVFHTLALSGNPNLCVPFTLDKFVSNVPLFYKPAGGSCHPTAR